MKKYVLEGFGCFVIGFLMFSVLAVHKSDYLCVSITLIACVFILTFLFKRKSGCFFNPAVAFGFLITKKITPKKFWAYCLSELIGFFVACILIFVLSIFSGSLVGTDRPLYNSYSTEIGIVGSSVFVAIIEIIATALLVFVYLIAFESKLKNSRRSFFVAMACGITFMLTTPVTFGSVNIARSMATSLFFGYGLIGLLS